MSKEFGRHAQNMITNIGSIVKHNGRERAPICSFTEHMNLHFENEQDIHMNFEKI